MIPDDFVVLKNTAAYYELNARSYADRVLKKLDRGAMDEFRSGLRPGNRILDAGCGGGRDLFQFQVHGFQAEGIDVSRSLCEIARKQSACEVKHADLLLLGGQNGTYDGIWANRVLPHLPLDGCKRTLATFFSLLKPGGTLFVSIEDGEGKYEDRSDNPDGPARTFFLYPKADFASLLRQHGFQILSEGHDLTHPKRIGWIARRIGPTP